MSTLQFDINPVLLPSQLDGAITGVTTLDPDGNPNRVLDPALPFDITVTWTNTGSLVPFLGGEYTVRLYVESVGPGPEREIGHQTVPVNASGSYSATVTVPAGLLPAAEPDMPNATGAFEPSGVYRTVAVVSYSNFGINQAIAGFDAGSMFEIRKP